jgi:hypothetical protein
MKAFTAALESMGNNPFSIGEIPPTPGLVDQYFNDSTGVGDEGGSDARGPWNEGGNWEVVEGPELEDERWSGGASYSFGFFSFGASASGGRQTVDVNDQHFGMSFCARNLNVFTCSRAGGLTGQRSKHSRTVLGFQMVQWQRELLTKVVEFVWGAHTTALLGNLEISVGEADFHS